MLIKDLQKYQYLFYETTRNNNSSVSHDLLDLYRATLSPLFGDKVPYLPTSAQGLKGVCYTDASKEILKKICFGSICVPHNYG